MSSSTSLRLIYGNFHFSAELLQEFYAAVELDDANHDDYDNNVIYIDEARYNELENTVAFCKRLGISFQLHEFDNMEFSYISWWIPGMDEPVVVDRHVDGSPMISFSAVLDAHQDGTISQLLERMPPELNSPTFDDACFPENAAKVE